MQNTNTAQLIPIATQAIAGEERQAVNARELHTFLEVEARFNDWIARRIEEYGFIENADFLVTQIQVTKPTRQDGNLFYSNLSKNPQGTLSKPLEKTRRGRPTKEYFLTLDTAKELAMVERNAKGREARRYFIECERQAKQAAPSLPDFTNPAEAARAWAAEVEKNAEQRKTLIEQGERLLKAEPKAAALDLLADSRGASNLSLTAKHLKIPRKRLIGILRNSKWIWAGSPIQATQAAIDSGVMVQVAGISERNGRQYTQALVTARGLAKLAVFIQGKAA